MLDYSGKYRSNVRSVDVSKAVADVESMISAFASRNAVIKYALASELPPILADPAQIEQVIVNLAMNAAEAVGANGDISISTDLVWGGAEDASSAETFERLPKGQCIRLGVADTGCGMDASTLTRIFDPFFTTKATGRGLGLAVVQGIVRSHGGS
jgi:signal transduction histidine kinase